MYVCVCVFRLQSDVSPDDQAQQTGGQQQSERWDRRFLHIHLSFTVFFPLCLTPCLPVSDSGWQWAHTGYQEVKAEVTEVPAPDGSDDNTGPHLFQNIIRDIQ